MCIFENLTTLRYFKKEKEESKIMVDIRGGTNTKKPSSIKFEFIKFEPRFVRMSEF